MTINMMIMGRRITHLAGCCSLPSPGPRLVHAEQLLESLKKIILNNKDVAQIELDVVEDEEENGEQKYGDEDKTC